MSKKHRQANRAAPRHTHSKRSRWPTLVVITGVIIAAAILWSRRGPLTDPPVVATREFEPAIAEQFDNALGRVRANPRSAAAWGTLGMIFEAHDFKSEAQSCYEQAERLNRTDPRWPYLQGLLSREEQPEVAFAKFERAARLERRGTDAAKFQFARLHFESGRLDEAEGQFKTLVQNNPNHLAARMTLAELHHVRGRSDQARDMLRLCLSNAHTAKRAHTLLGEIEQRSGRLPEARLTLRQAAALPADFPWPEPFSAEVASHRIGRKAWHEQAKQLLDQRRHDEAQPLIDRLIAQYPAAEEVWLSQGRARLERGDCVGAEVAFQKVLQLDSNSVNGHAQLGIALLCQDRYGEAIPQFQRALVLKPDFGEAHFNLGFALGRAGRAAEAIEPFRLAIRHSPNFVEPYVTLADLLNQKGETEEARALLRRALQLAPADERAKALAQRIRL